MRYLADIRLILLVITTWIVSVTIVYTAMMLVSGGPPSIAPYVSAVITLALCRWVWNGSKLARGVTVTWSIIAVASMIALFSHAQSTSVFLAIVSAISAAIWIWFGISLLVSSRVRDTLSAHWKQVRSTDSVPPYGDIYFRGAVGGIVAAIILLGVGWAEKEIQSYHASQRSQRWLEDLAAEVNQRTPSIVSDWLVFTHLKVEPLGLVYEFEITSLGEDVTMKDVKQTIMEARSEAECDNEFVKRMVTNNVSIKRRYKNPQSKEEFVWSFSDYCKNVYSFVPQDTNASAPLQ